MVPIQGYIQLRPQTEGTLPAFGFASQSSPPSDPQPDPPTFWDYVKVSTDTQTS